MDNERYRELDTVVYDVYCIFLKEGEKDKCIKLIDFDRHNDSHMALFYIAQMEKKIVDYKLEIKCKIRDYLWMKRRFNKLVSFKMCRDYGEHSDCKYITNAIEQMYGEGVLKEVYETYYKR